MRSNIPPLPDNAASLPPEILWGEGYVVGFEAASALANARLAAALARLPESLADDVIDALAAARKNEESGERI